MYNVNSTASGAGRCIGIYTLGRDAPEARASLRNQHGASVMLHRAVVSPVPPRWVTGADLAAARTTECQSYEASGTHTHTPLTHNDRKEALTREFALARHMPRRVIERRPSL